MDGTAIRAEDGETDEEISGVRRGGGGYEGDADGNVAGGAGGTGSGAQGEVKQLIEALEKRIKQLEDEAKAAKNKSNQEGKYELVNVKQMTPSVLKDSTAFRTWREEFERYAGLKVRGMQEVLKLIGGKKQWGTGLQDDVDKKLKELGYWTDRVK